MTFQRGKDKKAGIKMMTTQVDQLSLILHEQGLESYRTAVERLIASIDDSERFVSKSYMKVWI